MVLISVSFSGKVGHEADPTYAVYMFTPTHTTPLYTADRDKA